MPNMSYSGKLTLPLPNSSSLPRRILQHSVARNIQTLIHLIDRRRRRRRKPPILPPFPFLKMIPINMIKPLIQSRSTITPEGNPSITEPTPEL
jgi:hypothetical protein